MKFNILDPLTPAMGYRFLEASAGTGKTFTIEHLVVRWILEGIPLNEILIVTFTKAATRELNDRIYQRLRLEREKSSKIEDALAGFAEARITTIHGFCKAMLSKFFLEAKCKLDLSREEETWKVWLEFLKSSECRAAFSAEELEAFFGDQFTKKFHELVRASKGSKETQEKLLASFKEYRAKLPERGATPDELMSAMRDALKQEPFVRAVQKQFSAVVIDEFQDTDEIQWDIFSTLFCKERNLRAFCVVGDPKQSIYAFRSADLYTYFSAKEHFSPEESATLQVNYRSDGALVSALNALFTSFGPKDWMQLPKWKRSIEVSPVQAGKEHIDNQEPCLRIVMAKEKEQNLYQHIAKTIHFWKKHGVLPREIAILVKNRYEARALIEFLQREGVKAHYSSRGQLADTAVFEAVFDFLLLLDRPRDRVRLKRVLAGPLMAWPIEALQRGDFDKTRIGLQHLIALYDEKGLVSCLEEFFETSWHGEIPIAERLLQNDDLSAFEEFRQIVDLLVGKNDLREARLFLTRLREEKAFGFEEMEKRSSVDDEAVEITTIFQSKGLEYEVVFPLGLATDRRRKEDDEERVAEKMRLFYVAMTRAKRCVYLPYLRQEEEKSPSIAEQFLSLGNIEHLSKLPFTLIEEVDGSSEEKMGRIIHEVEIPKPSSFERRFASRVWTSFSSLTKEGASIPKMLPMQAKDEPLPVGAETGKEIHGILQKVFELSLHHPYNSEEIQKLTKEGVFDLVDGVFHTPIVPLIAGKASFTLKEVPKQCLAPEMEFVYEKQRDLIKGFIDLVFFHDGLYYIADWKTNWLPEYSPEMIEESMLQHAYHLQAKIYKEALERYVKLFDSRPFDQLFGGAYYLYLRGKQWKSFLP